MNEDNVQDETLRDGTAESSGSDSADNIPDNNDSETAPVDEVLSGVVEVDPVTVEPNTNDISWNVAFLFVVSMIVGLLIFSNLSRKWHS